jgi:hypothetical protein
MSGLPAFYTGAKAGASPGGAGKRGFPAMPVLLHIAKIKRKVVAMCGDACV